MREGSTTTSSSSSDSDTTAAAAQPPAVQQDAAPEGPPAVAAAPAEAPAAPAEAPAVPLQLVDAQQGGRNLPQSERCHPAAFSLILFNFYSHESEWSDASDCAQHPVCLRLSTCHALMHLPLHGDPAFRSSHQPLCDLPAGSHLQRRRCCYRHCETRAAPS
jgi:hypothetical protein